jgi:hypothetical protein
LGGDGEGSGKGKWVGVVAAEFGDLPGSGESSQIFENNPMQSSPKPGIIVGGKTIPELRKREVCDANGPF